MDWMFFWNPLFPVDTIKLVFHRSLGALKVPRTAGLLGGVVVAAVAWPVSPKHSSRKLGKKAHRKAANVHIVKLA